MTKNLQIGANSIKIFAISNSVLKPDFYESSFLVTEKNLELHNNVIKIESKEDKIDYNIWIIPIVLVIGIAIYLKIKYQSKP
jgi:peptide/nickel transport system substrate-binding protein